MAACGLDVGLDPMIPRTLRTQPGLKADAGQTELPRHPGK